MVKVILASASPRRKELLTQAGVTFEVIPSEGEEIITKENPAEAVQELALQKARETAGRLLKKARETADGLPKKGRMTCIQGKHEPCEYGQKLPEAGEETLILGADTVVAFDGKILGKPKDKADAVRMLTMLSGNTHSVFTGVALIHSKDGAVSVLQFYEETAVTMYPMSQKEIAFYVATGEPMDKAGIHIRNTDKPSYPWQGKAGGYGIQDAFGMKYIQGIKGDYYNVVGLPVSRLFHELKKMGIHV